MGKYERYFSNPDSLLCIGTFMSILCLLALVLNIASFIVHYFETRDVIFISILGKKYFELNQSNLLLLFYIDFLLVLYEIVAFLIYFITAGYYSSFCCTQWIKVSAAQNMLHETIECCLNFTNVHYIRNGTSRIIERKSNSGRVWLWRALACNWRRSIFSPMPDSLQSRTVENTTQNVLGSPDPPGYIPEYRVRFYLDYPTCAVQIMWFNAVTLCTGLVMVRVTRHFWKK
jgi:hypothetical protein